MASLGRAFYAVGFWIRETGQALDRLGSRLQGTYLFQEQVSRHRTLMNLCDKVPVVDKNAFVAPSASIVGDVYVGPSSSIWYGCVLRGDANSISIGTRTNIQDNSLVHVWGGNPAKFLRKLTDDEIAFISQSATNYASLAQAHASENAKELDKVEFEKVLRKKFSGQDEAYGSLLGAVRETQPELINDKAA
ncbi:Gamma carbonic anhydrase 1- mitochondrial [Striga hermonthica]|uniref:Gamma carbonic anhydrase 1- mitochondrial n=1 Tax=Striga hermonthica TaxID=68872 RepID=A0A9N7NLE6_STRHE|nr:Gamma carbonic anhydrase 1- mitochondrial [Striga hermonthica]